MATADGDGEATSNWHSQLFVAFLMVAVIFTGSLNNVLSQIRSVPLEQYNYLTALLNSCVYAFVWGLFVIVRSSQGWCSGSLRHVYGKSGAWRLLCFAGLGDTFGQVLGFIGQPHVSLPLYSLANQFIVFFTVIFSAIFLRARYICGELLAVLIVVCGVVMLIVGKRDDKQTEIGYLALIAVSTAGNAISFVFKELTFRSYKQEREVRAAAAAPSDTEAPLTGGPPPERVPEHEPMLDIFVVSSCTSLFGIIFAILMVPVNIFFNQTGGKPILEFFEDGFTCLSNRVPEGNTPKGGECTFAWQSWAIYIVANLLYNFSLLITVKYGSALLAFLSLKVVTPTSMVLGLVAWHMGPITLKAAKVGPTGWISLCLVLVGVCLFRYGNIVKDRVPGDTRKCCWPIGLCCKTGRLVLPAAGRVEEP